MYHLLTGTVPFHADNFMGILTKHMLETVVPPRQRAPELGIPADVEAVCLRALEKDRDNRWQDMDAFYRALGAAGGEPFESSGVYAPGIHGPSAALRYPVLAPSNPVVREMRTEVAPPAVAQPESFEDERPIVRKAAGLKLGGVVAVVAIVGVLAIWELKPSPKIAPAASRPPVVAPVTAAVTPPLAAPPPPAPTSVVAPVPVAKPASRAEAGHAAHGKPHRSSADAVRDITAKAGVTAPPPAAEKPASSTPAELKNPFGNP
jgi:hypothetical protein